MVCHRHLVARAHSHSDTIVDWDASDEQPGRQEKLALAGSVATRKPGVVGFKFRPEIFADSVLESSIPGEWPSQPIFSSVRKRDPNRRLHVEVAEAVPMFFRMGKDETRNMPLSSGSCGSSIGLSTDEPWPLHRPSGLQRIYVFNPRAWTRDSYSQVMHRVHQWQ